MCCSPRKDQILLSGEHTRQGRSQLGFCQGGAPRQGRAAARCGRTPACGYPLTLGFHVCLRRAQICDDVRPPYQLVCLHWPPCREKRMGTVHNLPRPSTFSPKVALQSRPCKVCAQCPAMAHNSPTHKDWVAHIDVCLPAEGLYPVIEVFLSGQWGNLSEQEGKGRD